MSLLNAITKPFAAPFKYIIDSRPARAVLTSKPFQALGKLYQNKYFATLAGLGMMGYGATLLPVSLPAALMGMLGGSATVNRARNPLVSKKSYDQLLGAAQKLKAQNSKLKMLGLPALGVAGLGLGYTIGSHKENKQG